MAEHVHHYLRSTQTLSLTGGEVYDLLTEQGSPPSQLEKSFNTTTFVELGHWHRSPDREVVVTENFPCSIEIMSLDGSVDLRFRLTHSDANDNIKATTGYSQEISTTGVHTFTLAFDSPAAWAEGDFVDLRVEGLRSGGHGTVRAYIGTERATSHVEMTLGELPADPEQALILFDGDVGTVPAGFQEIWVQDSNREILYAADAVGERVFRRVGLNSAARKVDAYTALAPAMDMEARCRFRLQGYVNNDVRIFVRASHNGAEELGIFCELFDSSTDGRIFRVARYRVGGLTTTSPQTYLYEPLVWYQTRVRVDGHRMRAKVWADGEVEPDWMIDFTPASNTIDEPGYAGIGEWPTINYIDYDCFSVGTNGADAPALPDRPNPDTNHVLPVTQVTAEQQGENVVLSWPTVSNANSYRVKRDGEDLGLVFDNSFVDEGVTPGLYEYSVLAARTTV